MAKIFDYLDYRAYLHDSYREIKQEKPYFSIRFISGKVGLNPGYITRVFQSKVHLGINNIPAFAGLLGLKEKEKEYFTELVHFGRAKNESEIEQRFENLQAIKGLKFQNVSDNAVEFYRNWYNMALRSLLSIYPFKGKNYRRLGSMLKPAISAAQARESVQLLEKLGIIKKDGEGVCRVTEQFISTGDRWMSPVIREYQKKAMELAIESLESVDRSVRDISTATMTFSISQLPALRERVAQFRQELLRMSQDIQDDDCVMQFNIQLFPSALLPGEES